MLNGEPFRSDLYSSSNGALSWSTTKDTFLRENDRHTNVFDEQTTTYRHPEFPREAASRALTRATATLMQRCRSGWLSRPCAGGSTSSSRNEMVLRQPVKS